MGQRQARQISPVLLFFVNGYEVEISISGEITRANIKWLRQMTKRSARQHLMGSNWRGWAWQKKERGGGGGRAEIKAKRGRQTTMRAGKEKAVEKLKQDVEASLGRGVAKSVPPLVADNSKRQKGGGRKRGGCKCLLICLLACLSAVCR